MIRNKYEQILDLFEVNYPDFYRQATDWWASGRMTIGVKLSNGEKIEYNHVDNTIRWLLTDDRAIDEDDSFYRHE